MQKKFVGIGIAALMIIMLAFAGCIIPSQEPKVVKVTVTGESQITAMPDLVVIYYRIEGNGTTAAIASDKAAKIYDTLYINLIKLGFEKSDVQTTSYSVNPDYVWEYGDYYVPRQTQIGYKAIHEIKVEFQSDETRLLGDAIEAGIDAGATINYINFEMSMTKQNEYKAQALEEATRDARIKANALATGAGKQVGELVSISTSDFFYYPTKMYDTITSGNLVPAVAEVVNIQPSNQDISAHVTVEYTLV